MRCTTLLRLLVTVAVGAAIGGISVALWPANLELAPPTRAVSLQLPSDHELLDLAIAPDASQIVYTAIANGRTDLYTRPLERFESRIVPGTKGATQPFFSPDGLAVGFFANGFLKTVTLAGDTEPVVVCAVPGSSAGGTWLEKGVVIFSGPGATGLREVPVTGGTPISLTSIDNNAGETAHGWPSVIDQRFLLFTVGRHSHDPRLTLLDLKTGDMRPLLAADGGGFVITSSHLVYARRGEFFSAAIQLIDPKGAPSPKPVINGVASSALGYERLGRALFAASRNGTLIFAPPASTGAGNQLVWVDRKGKAEAIDDVIAQHGTPRLSPDGQRIAFGMVTDFLRRDLWLYELETGRRQQITETAGDNHSPLWSSRGNTVTFASSRTGLQRIFEMSLPSLDTKGPLFDGDQRTPGSWLPNGILMFHEIHPSRGRDIWMWSESAAEPTPWLATGSNERAPRVSLDGKWIAYVSDEEGEGDQIYLRDANTNPQIDDRVFRVSRIGGTEAVWGKTGERLFFRRGRGFYEVEFSHIEPRIGKPVHLFDGPYLSDVLSNLPAYDVALDDNRFLMLKLANSTRVVHLLSGWQAKVFPPTAK